jgi:hypothetical protein
VVVAGRLDAGTLVAGTLAGEDGVDVALVGAGPGWVAGGLVLTRWVEV